jgi:hypothetical protein
MKIMPGLTVPARTVEAMQTGNIMKMLSAATMPAITTHATTNANYKVGNLPKKPAPKRSRAAKVGPKCGTKGGRKRGHKGSSLNDLNFLFSLKQLPLLQQ